MQHSWLTVCTGLHDGDDGFYCDFVCDAMIYMADQLHHVNYINHSMDILVDQPLKLRKAQIKSMKSF